MSTTAFLGSSALTFREPAVPVDRMPQPVRTSSWRFLSPEENLRPLSWLVAVTGVFLLTGIAGLVREEPGLVITLSGAAGKGASEVASQDTTMAELQALEQAPEIQTDATATPEVVEVPELTQVVPDVADLPELTEALVTEDVFAVPAAPRIETALQPVTPAARPKPKPQPRQVAAQPGRSRATTTAAGAPGGTQGNGGGGGGNGAVGSGGKGRFPAPPYPSFARSRGIQGSVTLTVRVSPSGIVEDATVSAGTGFSELDNYAASWVRRNWRFPAGAVRSFRLPISFKLR